MRRELPSRLAFDLCIVATAAKLSAWFVRATLYNSTIVLNPPQNIRMPSNGSFFGSI